MNRRLTARVLLFDPQDRLLLMKGRLPGVARGEGAGAWFTVGGGAEPGESVLEAAAREVREETGFSDFELGPVVWRREGELMLSQRPVWMDEHYVLARCAGGEPARHGWEDYEHDLIDDIRWWTHQALLETQEPVFPLGLAERLHDILAGRLPEAPQRIPW